MATQFKDTFTGSGALESHTPEVGFPGGVWGNTYGQFQLSGGKVYFPLGSVQDYTGVSYGDVSGAIQGGFSDTINFSFVTGPDTTLPPGGDVFGCEVYVIGQFRANMSATDYNGEGWTISVGDGGSSFKFFIAQPAPNTEYPGVFTYAHGIKTATLNGVTKSWAETSPKTSLSLIRIGLGGTMGIGYIEASSSDAWWTSFIGTSEIT